MRKENTVRRIGIIIATATTGLLLAGIGPARAQYSGWGPRLGVSINPDQIRFGGHMDFRAGSQVRLQPNIEVGVGDNMTLLSMNFDAAYRFRQQWDVWTPYLGGGVGLNVVSDDNHGVLDQSSSEAGLNMIGGIEKGLSSGSRFFVESKLGLIDAPDVMFTVGWTFGP